MAPLSSVRAQLFLTIQPRGEAYLNSELGMPEGRADFSSVKELLFPLRLSTAGVSDRSPVEVHILVQHRGAPIERPVASTQMLNRHASRRYVVRTLLQDVSALLRRPAPARDAAVQRLPFCHKTGTTAMDRLTSQKAVGDQLATPRRGQSV